MKFIYVDESGEPSHSAFFVMGGILIDAYKLRKASSCLEKLMGDFYDYQLKKRPDEIKTSNLLDGKGIWKKVDPTLRKDFITDICDIVAQNSLYLIPIEFDKHTTVDKSSLPKELQDYWHCAGMYVSGLVQKKMQDVASNKGLTVLIVDDNKKKMAPFSNLLHNHKGTAYDVLTSFPVKKKTRERFDQFINTAFAIDSKHSSFVQAADVVSYIYRRHLEILKDGQAWDGEHDYINGLFVKLEKKRIKLGKLSSKDDPVISFYNQIIPEGWKL